jgi:hypothetical protein
MNPSTDFAAMLEQALRLLSQTAAPSAELSALAEKMREGARRIDEAEAMAPQRRASALTIVPTDRAPRLDAIVTALETLDAESRNRAVQREIAVSLAAQLDARACAVAEAEALRDKARKPLEAETKRARELAKRIGEAPKLFKQVVSQFSADIVIAHLGKSAWSRTPRPQGSHVGYDISFDDIVPRIIATQEALSSVRLPGFSKHDFSALERAHHYEDTDSEYFGAVIAQALQELRGLIRNHDERRIVLSDEGVARAVQRAQTALVSEYSKTYGAIHELLALDAKIIATDCAARYPDGALIFDPAMFPEHWQIGAMNRTINGYPRVALPSINGFALAAE